MVRLRNLLVELRRRNVWRAVVVYVAATWALSQGIAQLAPYIGMPDWVVRWFLVACVIGFPFWVAFAWFYAWTPQGLKREVEVERDAALTRSTGRKLDFWIIGCMAVAIVLLATNQFVLHRDATSLANDADAKAALAALARVPNQSVAVLPLANESGDPKQQYFSDGLSEELISDLTQIDGLKVIGKYSSFKFRDSRDSPAQIGATLGVAHLIEGSVRQSNGNVRIMVNLISAKDGTSIWSHAYDQPLQDVFAIQSQIGHAVASALQVQLLGKRIAADDKPPGGNVQAYQLMLQGRAIARHSTEADYRQGLALLQQAVQIDPAYAYAWGVIADCEINLGLDYLQADAQQQAYAAARMAADKAFALAPDAVATHLVRGYVLAQLDGDQEGALVEYRRALARSPNDSATLAFLGTQYSTLGQLQQAAAVLRKAIATDPLRPDWYYNLSLVLGSQGQLDQATQAIRKVIGLQPDYPGAYTQLSLIDILRGDTGAARQDAGKETDLDAKAAALALTEQVGGNAKAADAARQGYIAKYGPARPDSVAELYALRQQPDAMFEWLQRARAVEGGALAVNLLMDPLLLRYKSDPRFVALCKQLGLPAPGEPLPGASASLPAGAATQ